MREADAAGESFAIHVNDRRVWVRGANWIPDDPFPTRVTPERLADYPNVDGVVAMLARALQRPAADLAQQLVPAAHAARHTGREHDGRDMELSAIHRRGEARQRPGRYFHQ